jgi:dipeptidase D
MRFIGGVYPNLDMISFGPTFVIRTHPTKKWKVASVKEFFNWLTETLKAIPVK